MSLKNKYEKAFKERLELKRKDFSIKVELNASGDLRTLEKMSRDIKSQLNILNKAGKAANDAFDKKISELNIEVGKITVLDGDFNDALSEYRGFMAEADRYYQTYDKMAEELGVDFTDSELFSELQNLMDDLGRNYGPESGINKEIVKALDRANDIEKKIKGL